MPDSKVKQDKSLQVNNIRLALCSAGELFGGVERQLLGLGSYLRETRGLRPHLILWHDQELAAQARQDGWEPVIIPSRHSLDPSSVGRLSDHLQSARINVVHAHGYKALVNCALARRRYPFALVKTEHGRPEPGHQNVISRIRSSMYNWMDTLATRWSRATVCYVTEDIRKQCTQEYCGLQQCTIHNGIEPLERKGISRPAQYEQGLFQVAIVGRVSAVKGITYALQAMASPDMPKHVRLNIVGTGPLVGVLQSEAEQRGVHEKVRFLGFRRNIFDYIAHCNALLMPSLHEGLPYTLLEAMSLATPILASRVGGLAEVLENDVTALLFPVGDVAGIVGAVRKLIANPETASRLAAAARSEQMSHYTLATMSESYLDVYRQVTV